MSVSLSDAVDDLLGRQTQDAGRLHLLAQFCVEAFDRQVFEAARRTKLESVDWVVRKIGILPMSSLESHGY
jgi:hypothetical protein